MTDGSRRVASVAATAAAAVAICCGLVVGAGAGILIETVVAATGATLVGVGAGRLAGDDPDRAAGSVTIGVGTLTLGAGVGLGLTIAPLVALALGLAVLVVTVDAGPGFSWAGTREVNHVLRRSGAVVFVGALLASAFHAGVLPVIAGGAVAAWRLALERSALAGLTVLAVELLAIVLAFGAVVSVLERWAPPEFRDGLAALSARRTTPAEVPVSVYAGVVLTAWGALTPAVAGFVASVLARLSPVGPAVGAALSSPALHLLPALTLVAFFSIAVGEAVRRAVVGWLGPVAPNAAVRASGGALVVTLTVVLTAIPTVGTAVAAPLPGRTASTVGVATVVLAGAGVALAALWVTLAATLLCSDLSAVPGDRAGFTLGSALLFVATLATALDGASAPVAFVGIAGTLLIHDLGEHATDLGGTVAPGSETSRAEVVHASASALVAVAAVGVGLLATYVVVPLAPRIGGGAGPAWAPELSLALAVLSLIAFLRLYALDGEERG